MCMSSPDMPAAPAPPPPPPPAPPPPAPTAQGLTTGARRAQTLAIPARKRGPAALTIQRDQATGVYAGLNIPQ